MSTAAFAPYTPEKALELLIIGNSRTVQFEKKQLENPEYNEKRAALARAQHPFAVIVSCSDSRFPPEIIFKNREGDIFVVRSAGHVLGDDTMGSIEYAIEHLHVPLILVMGHEYCGAVTAALNHLKEPGHIHDVIERIAVSIEKSVDMPGDTLTNAIDMHVNETIKIIKNDEPVIAEKVRHGKLKVIGARVSLKDYEIKWFDTGPSMLRHKDAPSITEE